MRSSRSTNALSTLLGEWFLSGFYIGMMRWMMPPSLRPRIWHHWRSLRRMWSVCKEIEVADRLLIQSRLVPPLSSRAQNLFLRQICISLWRINGECNPVYAVYYLFVCLSVCLIDYLSDRQFRLYLSTSPSPQPSILLPPPAVKTGHRTWSWLLIGIFWRKLLFIILKSFVNCSLDKARR